jgi:ATP-dependent Clp protease ATP-binding subunit ClpA
MFERFSESGRQVVVRAQEEARELRAECIGTEHLLLALAAEPAGPAGRALRGLGLDATALRPDVGRVQRSAEPDADALAVLGIDLDEVRRRVEAAFGPGALERRRECRRGASDRARIPFTPVSKRTLELALHEALKRGDNFIGTQHILLGVLEAGDTGALMVLRRHRRSADEVEAALLAEIDSPGSGRAAG